MDAADLPKINAGPRAFESFPYLVILVVSKLCHVSLLPRSFKPEFLRGVAVWQASANKLQACLVLGERDCYYYSPDGTERRSSVVPRGGVIVSGMLQLCVQFEQDEELQVRSRLLDEHQDKHGVGTGALFGDITKGGHDATLSERTLLEGKQRNGVPRGLVQCPTCGDWKGRCLDPSPAFEGKVMTVHCRCGNDNRCAACGNTLYVYKLNSNYFARRGGQIWHVPAFCCLSHHCYHEPILVG